MAIAITLGFTASASADGAQLFDNNCSFCHQAKGVGVPGQFPRLAGRVGAIAATPQGKKFLPVILLDGMSGRIVVDGQPILGIMPSFDMLSDQDLASVLTYVTGLDHKPVTFTAQDFKVARSRPKLSSMAVAAEASRLAAEKIIP